MSRRYGRAEEELGTSWVSVISGWLAALGASLILVSLVSTVVATIFSVLGFQGFSEAGISGLVGLVITFFLSFLIGGYVAGRMASRSGTKHGVFVVVLALVITIALTLLGSAVATPLVDLPGVTFNVPRNIPGDISGLGIVFSVTGLLVLIFMFAGGIIGGERGARVGRRRR